jgi:hypothetical protein
VFYHCHHWIGILCPPISDVTRREHKRDTSPYCAASSAKVAKKRTPTRATPALFKEVSASKVALYPLLMLPTLPIEPQPAAIHSVQLRPASPADSRPLFAFAGIWTEFRGDRGTKSKPIPGPHLIYGG